METPNERPIRLVYARYQVTGLLAAELARKLPGILAELQSARPEAGKYAWTIGDIGERTVDGEKLLFGRLGKTARAAVATHSDDSVPSFGHQPRQGKKAACSNFFISPSNSIIVLEDKPQLPGAKFLKKFKQLWAAGHPTEIDFAFLHNEMEIFEAINRWDKVTAARFELSSTHPRPREDFASLDQLLKKSKAIRASFKFAGGDDGLAAADSIIQQGVSMSAAGYGEFSLKGVEQGSKTSLNSKDCWMANELVGVDNLESLAPVVLAGIRKILDANQPARTIHNT